MSLPESYTLQIKQIFLNFLQTFFAQVADSRYTWSSDFRSSKIIIADKNSIDRPTNEKRPLLILSRQSIRPMFTTLGQMSKQNFATNMKSHKDLLAGSVTINCMSKSGMQAEELAHIVMMAFLSYRDKLKGYNGIHQITGIQLGEETNVIVDVNSILVNVPVIIQFTKNIGWTPAPLLSSALRIEYTQSGIAYYWYEGLDYDVFRNRVTTYDYLASGLSASITYLHNITLSGITETLTGVDGITNVFILSNPVYSYYPKLQSVEVDYTVSGLTYAYSGGAAEPTASGWLVSSSGFQGML